MTHKSESPESAPLKPEEVIAILDATGIQSPEAIAVLTQYADQCHLESEQESRELPGSDPNRSNIQAEIKIALVYFKSRKYRDYGREELIAAYDNAKQNDETLDLADYVVDLLEMAR